MGGNMKKINQKGIAHLGLIVVVVALLIAGAAGFFVYQNNKDEKNSISSADNSSQQTEGLDNQKIPEGSRLYKDEVAKFTVFYPETWVVKTSNSSNDSTSTVISNPKGSSLTLVSNPGGRGASGDCSVNEKTGEIKWIFADDNLKSNDPCPYTVYHKVKQLDSKITDREGKTQNLYLVEQSVGLSDKRTYGVCIVPGPLAEGEKKYGINFIDTDFNDYDSSSARSVKACVTQTGDKIEFFENVGIKEAVATLGTFKLY